MNKASGAAKAWILAGVVALASCGGDKEPAKDDGKKPEAAGDKKESSDAKPGDAKGADAKADGAKVTIEVKGPKPPADDVVKKDVTGNGSGVISVELDKAPGKEEWNTAQKAWLWDKGVTVIRDANLAQFPGVKLKVTGYARYDSTGASYNYREFKVTDNSYDGIPKPTDAEALAVVKQHLQQILAGQSGSMVNGDKLEVTMAAGDDQKWEWDDPNKVSFKIKAKYDYKKNNTEIESREEILPVKIFRDSPTAAWNNAISLGAGEMKSTSVKKYTEDEVRAMKTGLPESAEGAARPGGR